MMNNDMNNLIDLLNYINPSMLDYTQWVSVGMVLKNTGASVGDWDSWSQKDTARYHNGDCSNKWDSFQGASKPVTIGTIVNMAKDQGWEPPKKIEHCELEWDSTISYEQGDNVIIDSNWVEDKEVKQPLTWDPAQELIQYLSILFESDDKVGYVTETWKKDDRYLPGKGAYDRTAGQLIKELKTCKGDIGQVIGDYKEEAGAWIRFNPLDGQGVKNANVTDYKYALIESDDMSIDKQNAIIRELELPVACLVHSGKKSIHAIVKIEADTYDIYRKRVDYVYDVCRRNGLVVDTQNRNPSRLSRMPGIMRNGQKQFLIDTNIGKKSYLDWEEWIADINDDLPEPETLISVWDNLPDLSPPLIHNILRQGHKMLLAGPSKAGKSYALIQLCCAIAEGRRWVNWDCTKGSVLYVNLELDRASCLHRFKDVYNALKWPPDNIKNISIWNLRGKAVPMDKLAPKLIRRAQKKTYTAIIIDPIYKVITGDENSADQMAHFCNQFDRVCHELGAAVIYCHHHSKGAQGGKKSMDRASGSGVFARDPDALLDLMELNLTDEIVDQQTDKAICDLCMEFLNKYNEKALDNMSQDVTVMAMHMEKETRKALTVDQEKLLDAAITETKRKVKLRSAWRIEGTLREFEKFPPVNIWFTYPIHKMDKMGVLEDISTEEMPLWQKAKAARKPKQERKKTRVEELDDAFSNCTFGEQVTIKALAEYMDLTERTLRRRVDENAKYIRKNGVVQKPSDGQ